MKTRITKLAAAAVMIIGVCLGIGLIPTGGGVVWAEVAQRVEQVRAVAYHMAVSVTGMTGMTGQKSMELEMDAMISTDLGMRIDTFAEGKLVSKTYMDMSEDAIISLIPEAKKYTRIKMTPEIFAKMRKENGDPKELVDMFLKGEYVELERSEINGVKVDGVESRDPSLADGMLGDVIGRLWVSVETGWPILVTMEVIGKDGKTQMEMSIDEFQWAINVDASEFTLTIPDDYESLANIDLSTLGSGEKIAEGLGSFAELSGGKYPSDLAIMTVSEELTEIIKTRMESDEPDKNPPKDLMQSLVSLQIAGPIGDQGEHVILDM